MAFAKMLNNEQMLIIVIIHIIRKDMALSKIDTGLHLLLPNPKNVENAK